MVAHRSLERCTSGVTKSVFFLQIFLNSHNSVIFHPISIIFFVLNSPADALSNGPNSDSMRRIVEKSQSLTPSFFNQSRFLFLFWKANHRLRKRFFPQKLKNTSSSLSKRRSKFPEIVPTGTCLWKLWIAITPSVLNRFQLFFFVLNSPVAALSNGPNPDSMRRIVEKSQSLTPSFFNQSRFLFLFWKANHRLRKRFFPQKLKNTSSSLSKRRSKFPEIVPTGTCLWKLWIAITPSVLNRFQLFFFVLNSPVAALSNGPNPDSMRRIVEKSQSLTPSFFNQSRFLFLLCKVKRK